MVGVVIGNYQLVRKLGEGGMGAVYLGQHTLLGRRAAVKVLLPELSARPDIVNRFFNEARAVTSISDPGIVQVFDFGYHTDGSAFIVMEYLDGEPLDRRLARMGRLPITEVLRLGRQLASSLAAAHAQRIIHRDLKPENVFLVADAEVVSGERSKILDFGIAKLSDEHPGKLKTHTGVLMGTPLYMSPEQCRGLAEVDHRSDIYSLGCVLFHLMTGRPPFDGEGPGDIMSSHIREAAPAPSSRAPDVPPQVDALVLRCLAKAPADRFQTMAELVVAIGHALQLTPANPPPYHLLPTAMVPVGAPPIPTTLGATAGQLGAVPGQARRRGLWVAAGLVVAAAGVAIVLVSTAGRDAPGATPQSPVPALPVEPSAPAGSDQTAGGTNSSTTVERPVAVVDAAAPVAPEPVVAEPDAPDPSVPPVVAPENPEPDAPPPPRPRRLRVPVDAGVTGEPRAPRAPKAPRDAGPKEPQPVAPAPAPDCGKATFAAVYNAAAPSRDAVRAAIRSLNACRKAGAISEAEYDQTHAALVARL